MIVLAPPNQEWPEWISSIPGANFGWFRRTRNEDRFDIDTSFYLTGESKDYKSKITSGTIQNMLARISETSKVHIIFVRQLQNEYFRKVRFPFLNICCCVIKSKGNGILKLYDVKRVARDAIIRREYVQTSLAFPD